MICYDDSRTKQVAAADMMLKSFLHCLLARGGSKEEEDERGHYYYKCTTNMHHVLFFLSLK